VSLQQQQDQVSQQRHQVSCIAKAPAVPDFLHCPFPSLRWRGSSSTAAGCSPRSTSTTGWASGSALATSGTSQTRQFPALATGPTATGASMSQATSPSPTTTWAMRSAAWPTPPRSLTARGAGPTTPATRPSSTSAGSCVGGRGAVLLALRLLGPAWACSGSHPYPPAACQHLEA
jgi:hypothetical protein